MSNYFRNLIGVFFLIWILVYVALCWLDFQLLNPVQVFWDLPSDRDHREMWSLFFCAWVAISALIASPFEALNALKLNRNNNS